MLFQVSAEWCQARSFLASSLKGYLDTMISAIIIWTISCMMPLFPCPFWVECSCISFTEYLKVVIKCLLYCTSSSLYLFSLQYFFIFNLPSQSTFVFTLIYYTVFPIFSLLFSSVHFQSTLFTSHSTFSFLFSLKFITPLFSLYFLSPFSLLLSPHSLLSISNFCIRFILSLYSLYLFYSIASPCIFLYYFLTLFFLFNFVFIFSLYFLTPTSPTSFSHSLDFVTQLYHSSFPLHFLKSLLFLYFLKFSLLCLFFLLKQKLHTSNKNKQTNVI